jgi:hypothetical protein
MAHWYTAEGEPQHFQTTAKLIEWAQVRGHESASVSEVYEYPLADWTAARDRGDEIHNDIERIWNGEEPVKHPEIASEAVNAIIDYTHTNKFIAEQTVVGDGYGGMIDLHNDDYVIDWKTKDVKDGKNLAYPENCMQLKAYDMALGWEHKPRKLVNVFIDREEPGKIVIHEWSREEAELAWEKFWCLLKFWQLDKKYVPE